MSEDSKCAGAPEQIEIEITDQLVSAGVRVLEDHAESWVTPSHLVALVCRAVLEAQEHAAIKAILPEAYRES